MFSYRIIGDGPHRSNYPVYLTQEEMRAGGQFLFVFLRDDISQVVVTPVEQLPHFPFVFEEILPQKREP